MTKSGTTALRASIAKSTAILAAAFMVAIATTSAQSATVNIPQNVVLDTNYADASSSEWKGRSNVEAMQGASEGIQVPPSAIFFLAGLLGVAILGRRRDRWLKRPQI